jgi:hypothetical protein
MEDIKKNKMTLFISFLVIVLLVIIGVSVIFTVKKPTTPQNPKISVTPTIIVATSVPTPTINYKNPNPTEMIEIQKQADTNWANDYNKTMQSYPWLKNMPISSDKYFVYFDESKKSFGADIYDKNSVESIKAEITQKLQSMNIDLNAYPIEWQVRQ